MAWRRVKAWIVVAVVSGLMLSALAVAEEATEEVPEAPAAEAVDDSVHISVHENVPGARSFYVDLKERVTIMEPEDGHVEIRRRDTHITARRGRYSEREDRADLEGDLHVRREDSELTGDELVAFFGREEYVVTGNVHLIRWQDDEAAEGGKRRTDLYADRVRFQEGAGELVAEGNVRVLEPDREARAQHAVFLEKEDRLTLTEDVEVITEDGDVIRCQHVVLDTASDLMEVFGTMEAVIRIRSE